MVNAAPLACEACRRRKAKCSGAPGPCSKCEYSGLVCIFSTTVKVRRTPKRSSRRVDELEDRLGRIESALSDIAQNTNQLKSELSRQRSAVPGIVAPANGGSSLDFPSSSSAEKLGNTGPFTLIAPRPPADAPTRVEFFSDIQHETSQPQLASSIPSLHSSLREIEDHFNHYFTTVMPIMPLFGKPTIMTILEDCAVDPNSRDLVQWSAVNAALALSHQSQVMQISSQNIDHTSIALQHLKDAMSVVGQLAMIQPTLLSARTLVGLAMAWQSTFAPQNANMILAMGIQQIRQLKLHQADGLDLDEEAEESRRRLLWIAYALDKDCSLRSDHPAIFSDDEMDFTRLPSWNIADGLGIIHATTDKPAIEYFRLYVNLSVIQSKIQQRLVQITPTTSSSTQNADEDDSLPDLVCDLISLLQTWKQQLPVTFQPVPLLRNFSQPSIIALVTLYVRYFSCMSLVHRRAYWNVGHLEAYQRSHEQAVANPCPSHKLCYVAARVSLQLLTVLPQGDVPCIWLLIDHFVSAALIILTGIIYESSLNTGWDDFQLVEPVVANLEACAQKGDSERLSYIRGNLLELQNAAKVMLEQIEARGWSTAPENPYKAATPAAYHWLYPDYVVDGKSS